MPDGAEVAPNSELASLTRCLAEAMPSSQRSKSDDERSSGVSEHCSEHVEQEIICRSNAGKAGGLRQLNDQRESYASEKHSLTVFRPSNDGEERNRDIQRDVSYKEDRAEGVGKVSEIRRPASQASLAWRQDYIAAPGVPPNQPTARTRAAGAITE